MAVCQYCGKKSNVVSGVMGFCADCIRSHFEDVWPEIKKVHAQSRRAFDLPEQAPKSKDGIPCKLCVQGCRIPKGGKGFCGQRPEPPFFIASTLLVPGYVDEVEVTKIAQFISGLNPDIPYSLLGFYPHFYLHDLPTTSRNHALRCKAAAESAGLRRVHIGNLHLLGRDY